MGDPLSEYLVSGNRGASQIDPDLLKLAGKKAAAEFLESEGGTLTDFVADRASQIDGIQNEHIRRMCEFANHAVHDALFQKEASAKDGHVIYVTFDPAQPSTVIQRLNDGTKVASLVLDGSQDFEFPPGRLLGFREDDDGWLQSVFLTKEARLEGSGKPEFNHPIEEHGETHKAPMNLSGELTGSTPDPVAVADRVGQPKTKLLDPTDSTFEFKVPDSKMRKEDPKLQKISEASVAYPRANPHHELFSLRTEIEGNRDAIRLQSEEMELRAQAAWEDFYGHAKTAMVEGMPFGDIAGMCHSVCNANERVYRATIEKLANQLMGDEVASYEELDRGLEKIAFNRDLNAESGMVQSYAGFLCLLGEHTKLASLVRELDSGLKDIDAYVRTLPERAAAGGSQ